MIRLGVNVDHVATIRQARGGIEPDPVTAAALSELGGADGITIHLREDRRHIQDRDVRLLRETVQTRLNLEMACEQSIIDIATEVKPEQVTLVPERREEITTEGGLNVLAEASKVEDAVRQLHDAGLPVSLFIDSTPEQIKAAADTGADYIELHTGVYAEARDDAQLQCFEELEKGVLTATELGLGVNAGHGLNYWNTALVCTLPHLDELNIGHSIVSRAVFVGLERAVREMKDLMRQG